MIKTHILTGADPSGIVRRCARRILCYHARLVPVLLILQVEANRSERHLRQHKHGCRTRSYWVGRATTSSLSDPLSSRNCVCPAKDNLHGKRCEYICLRRGVCVRPHRNRLCASSCHACCADQEIMPTMSSGLPRGDGREQIRALEPLAVPSSDFSVS